MSDHHTNQHTIPGTPTAMMPRAVAIRWQRTDPRNTPTISVIIEDIDPQRNTCHIDITRHDTGQPPRVLQRGRIGCRLTPLPSALRPAMLQIETPHITVIINSETGALHWVHATDLLAEAGFHPGTYDPPLAFDISATAISA